MSIGPRLPSGALFPPLPTMSMQQRHLLKSEPWVSVCPLFPPHLRRQSARPVPGSRIRNSSSSPCISLHPPSPDCHCPRFCSSLLFIIPSDPRVGGLRDKSVPVTLLTNRKSLSSSLGKSPSSQPDFKPLLLQQPLLPAPLSPATLASVFSAKRRSSPAFKSPRLRPHRALYLDDSSFRFYPRFFFSLSPQFLPQGFFHVTGSCQSGVTGGWDPRQPQVFSPATPPTTSLQASPEVSVAPWQPWEKRPSELP